MRTLKLIFMLCLVSGLAVVVHEWLAARRDAQQLIQTLAAQSKIVTASDANRHENEMNLKKALQQIDALKRNVKTPAAAVQGLNQWLPLPTPIVISSGDGSRMDSVGSATPVGESNVATGLASSKSVANDLPSRPKSITSFSAGAASLPAADLLPLYRYTQDCRACAVELDASKANALEDQKKITALETQRDAALKVSRNGNVALRIKGAATWIAVGVGLGVVLSSAPRQSKFP